MNTFLFQSNYFDPAVLERIFLKRSNWRKYDETKDTSITYFYVDASYFFSKLYHTLPSDIKNITDGREIFSNKSNFHEIFKTTFPTIHNKYMMNYYNITITNYSNVPKHIFNNSIYIIKPNSGSLGEGIEVLTSYHDFLKYVNNTGYVYKKNGWVLEEYIIDPLLFDGLKFHLRMYALYTVMRAKRNIYLFKYGKIIKARQLYKKNDFMNKQIHDTHVYGQEHTEFPKDCTHVLNYDTIFEQVYDLTKYIGKMFKGSCYSDAKNCYILLSYDIMILPDQKIKLLEVNTKTGLSQRKESDIFYEKMFEGIFQKTVDKIVDNSKDNIIKTTDWIRIK